MSFVSHGTYQRSHSQRHHRDIGISLFVHGCIHLCMHTFVCVCVRAHGRIPTCRQHLTFTYCTYHVYSLLLSFLIYTLRSIGAYRRTCVYIYIYICMYRLICRHAMHTRLCRSMIPPAFSALVLCWGSARLQIANLLDTVLVAGGLVDIFVSMCLDSFSSRLALLHLPRVPVAIATCGYPVRIVHTVILLKITAKNKLLGVL